MPGLKKHLNMILNLTDMGTPSKIVEIEINVEDDKLTLSQGQYIDSILRKYKMQDANPVLTPLDPNVKLEVNVMIMIKGGDQAASTNMHH